MKAYRVLSTFAVAAFGVLAFTACTAQDPQGRTAQIRSIDTYVRGIEDALPGLTRNEVLLQPGALADVTSVQWSKLHAYARNGAIQRVKLYPPAGSTKTEEFYYRDGSLVMVFEEPNGAGHEGHNPDATGTRYYFNADALFAVKDDSGITTQLNEQQEAMGKKLLAESRALLRIGAANEG